MAQVVTPPSMGMQEQASKNWYHAEALRKVKSDLVNVMHNIEVIDINTDAAYNNLKIAADAIEKARLILNPPPKPAVKRVRPGSV